MRKRFNTWLASHRRAQALDEAQKAMQRAQRGIDLSMATVLAIIVLVAYFAIFSGAAPSTIKPAGARTSTRTAP